MCWRRMVGDLWCAVRAADNQVKMAKDGGVHMLIPLLRSTSDPVQRQAAKALANLGVNGAGIGVCVLRSVP